MKKKGVFLIILGILGIIFVCTYDILVGKPVNDFTGPKSYLGFAISGALILVGVRLWLTKSS